MSKKKQFVFLFLFLFLFNSASLFSQESGTVQLIPRQIYIGDPAALIVTLAAAGQNYNDIVMTSNLPVHDSIDFHRITLERRAAFSRLIIEFSAYSTGELELPVIEIGGYYFPNLSITVNSIVDTGSPVRLSSPAAALSMPGTVTMLYGIMAAIAAIVLAGIWFIIKGKSIIKKIKSKIKRWRLFASIRHTERRLHKAALKGTDNRIVLDKLSCGVRTFLSVLTNNNCMALTPGELGILEENSFSFSNPPFLENFFRDCDNFRFSGTVADKETIIKLLKDLRVFISRAEEEQHEF